METSDSIDSISEITLSMKTSRCGDLSSKAAVLELVLDLLDTQPVSQRRVDVERLPRNAALFLL
jgi:hypothetical protein